MSHSKWTGHWIEVVNNVWIYSDNKKPVSECEDRPCGNCGMPRTPEGHDGCIGTIPGVMNACCGHGNPEEAYVQYSQDHRVSGEEALEIMKGNRIRGVS